MASTPSEPFDLASGGKASAPADPDAGKLVCKVVVSGGSEMDDLPDDGWRAFVGQRELTATPVAFLFQPPAEADGGRGFAGKWGDIRELASAVEKTGTFLFDFSPLGRRWIFRVQVVDGDVAALGRLLSSLPPSAYKLRCRKCGGAYSKVEGSCPNCQKQTSLSLPRHGGSLIAVGFVLIAAGMVISFGTYFLGQSGALHLISLLPTFAGVFLVCRGVYKMLTGKH